MNDYLFSQHLSASADRIKVYRPAVVAEQEGIDAA